MGDKGQCTQRVLSPRPPPYTDVARQFGDLERIAERCSMAGVSYNLRRARLAWRSEARSKLAWQTSCNIAEAADKRISCMPECLLKGVGCTVGA